MNRMQAPRPHHDLSITGMAPWPVPDIRDVEADPAARCCKECGRRLLVLLLRSSTWVSRRAEHVTFRDDRSVVRRVTVEFYVPEEAPVFRGDDGQPYSLLPLSVMRRKTLVNFELRDHEGRSVVMPSLRQNQAITESMLLACANATLEQDRNKSRAGFASRQEIAGFIHQVASGDQRQLTAAYKSLKRGTAAPAVLSLYEQRMFKVLLDRLASNFVLWVMIPAGAPRRRVLTFSCDEPLYLHYREPGFKNNEYRLRPELSPWRPVVWSAALGLAPTRIRFPVPAAENAASFHFEIDAPPGVQIVEASLLAGRPEQKNPSFDHVQGGFPTVGLHVIEVANGSLSRAQIGLQVVTRGWLTISMLASWAVFGLVLAFALHRTSLKTAGEVPVVILLALAGGVAALIAQSDARGLAAHLLKWTRSLATIAAALPLVATTFIAFENVHPTHVAPALWAVVGVGGFIAMLLTAVCFLSWNRQSKIVRSPWEQGPKLGKASKQPKNFNEAATRYHYNRPAIVVDSAEGSHEQFLWDDESENLLVAALERPSSTDHVLYETNGLANGSIFTRNNKIVLRARFYRKSSDV